jgi:5-dehydro-4-deoxyglucarate dehydratase
MMQPAELKTRLKGIHAYAVTPFRPDFEVDLPGLAGNIEALAGSGVHVIVACGGTGEFYSLELEEYRDVVATVTQVVGGRVPVVAGVGYGTRIASNLARVAESAGADGILMLPPYFVRASDDGLVAHYQAVAGSVAIGAIVYSTTWAIASAELVARLAEIPNIVGFKDENGDVRLFERIRDRVGDRLAWICGMSEHNAHLYFVVGAEAITSGVANIAPRLSLEIYAAAAAKDYEAVRNLIRTKLGPISHLRESRPGYHVPVIKAAMDLLGLAGGRSRPPLLPVREEDRAILLGILRDMGLLPAA